MVMSSPRHKSSNHQMDFSRNLEIFSWTQSLTPGLNWPILVQFLRDGDKEFQFSEPLQVKLFFARVRVVLGMMIFPCLLSFVNKDARYSGSLALLILNTVSRVWYTTNWLTVSHFNLLYITSLLDLGGECVTTCAALFCRTCKLFIWSVLHPPNTGRQYTMTLLNIPRVMVFLIW